MLLKKHDFGSVLAIGIEDTSPQNIEYKFFSFWNHGATNGELNWLHDKFAYFWTNPESLKKAVINMCLFELLNIDCGKSKGKINGLMPEAIRLAQQRLNEMIPCIFVENESAPNNLGMPYQMGYINFESPDISSL